MERKGWKLRGETETVTVGVGSGWRWALAVGSRVEVEKNRDDGWARSEKRSRKGGRKPSVQVIFFVFDCSYGLSSRVEKGTGEERKGKKSKN